MTTKTYGQLKTSQKAILDFIERYIDSHGYPPSFRDIADGANLTLSVVNHNIGLLVEWGYLDQTEGISRGLRLVDRELESRRISNNILTISINLLSPREQLIADVSAGIKQLQSLVRQFEAGWIEDD